MLTTVMHSHRLRELQRELGEQPIQDEKAHTNRKRNIALTVLVGLGVGLLTWIFYTSFRRTQPEVLSNRPQVITTFTVLADMAKNVAGNKADIRSLTKPGAEIHGYEPTPHDITAVKGADLVLDNGLNLEKWAEKLYTNAPDVPHVTLTKGITPMNIVEGPYVDKPNPHAWMSPGNALAYVDNITAALSNIDPVNENSYKDNARKYKAQIGKINTLLKQELGALTPSNRYLVSCEGAFSYLIRDYSLQELYLWPINADAQGTPEQIRKVVDAVRSQHIPAVFCESTVSGKAMEQVASETGARYGGVFYVDSLSGEYGPTPTYLKLLEYNARTLIEGLVRE